MSTFQVMCNGHKYLKTSLFSCPSYLADLSPYINHVISSRILTTPIQITSYAMKPIAQSILPTRVSNYILNETLTCEYCLHQVSQDSFDDGKICPFLLLQRLGLGNDEFVLADQLLAAQDERKISRCKNSLQLSGSMSSNSASTDNTQSNRVSSDVDTSSNPDGERSSSTQSNKPPSAKQIHDEAQSFREDILIMRICPEIGLHAQKFKCVDCKEKVDINNSRLCHYDGCYYCFQCHTGSDLVTIPARIIRNWDFTPKPVSRTSLEKICFIRSRPVLFNLFQMNSMLYGFIDRLVEIKQTRLRIHSMLKYINVCGQPNRPSLMLVPKHIQSEEFLNLFTLNDLMDINKVFDFITQLQITLEAHITRECESCRGKGFYCELCKDPRDILYPFSKNGAICSSCKTVYHKNCFHRKKLNCPKCARVKYITKEIN